MFHVIIIFSKSLSYNHSTITPSFSNIVEKDINILLIFNRIVGFDTEHPGVCPLDTRMLKAGLPGCPRAFAGTFMKKRVLL